MGGINAPAMHRNPSLIEMETARGFPEQAKKNRALMHQSDGHNRLMASIPAKTG
jgi:hypothetical protein